jgi:preprotein translocase subunit SecG
MLYQVIIIFHVLLGVGIVGLVLMQHGKGADAGAAFGSGSSGTVFGAQGSASFLSRTTAIFAALFFTTSLGLAVLGGYSGKKSGLDRDYQCRRK